MGFEANIATPSDFTDTGVSTFVYDQAGNLTRQNFADASWDAFQYDALNRMTHRSVRASSGVPNGGSAFTYRYDETLTNGVANLGIGRLTQVWLDGPLPPNANRWYQYFYDARGNLLKEIVQPVAGAGAFATSYSYNLADNLTQLIHNDGRILNYAYDVMGHVSTVTTQANAAAAAVTLASAIVYQPLGAMKSEILGNGVTQSEAFDLDERIANQRRHRHDPRLCVRHP